MKTSVAASAVLSMVTAVAGAPSTFYPARPPSIPLAVKSPYLSTWQQAGSDGGNGGYLAGQWPTFWQNQITGWTGMIRVDEAVYTWMGAPLKTNGTQGEIVPVVNQTAFSYTSARSIFNMDVGGAINMTITFMSNVQPNDFQRQSLPLSYMDVSVQSLDGQPHNVQLYSDISAEWVSGDRSAVAQWDYEVLQNGTQSTASKRDAEPEARPATHLAANHIEERQNGQSHRTYGTSTSYTGWTTSVIHPTSGAAVRTSGFVDPMPTTAPTKAPAPPAVQRNGPPATDGGIAYHKVFRQEQAEFNETLDQADWGTWYYATSNVKNLTHQSGPDASVRDQFQNTGSLTQYEDPNYRAINDSYPTFGFAIDLGEVGSTPVDTLWTISIHQDNAVLFEGAQGNSSVPSLWKSYFSNDLDALKFYFDDYLDQCGLATDLDNKIEGDSNAAAGGNYALLTSLATRQAYGATILAGTTAEPFVFMKEISSDGDTNTVDIIFPAFPMFLYLSPMYIKMLLDPLYINQEAGYWPYSFSIHDLGVFPKAVGYNGEFAMNAEMQPLEECGNMIIMSLAYAQRTGDTGYLSQHYDILRQWNNYLVNDSLIPSNQISTDDFAGALANQTDLAIKGIIGIQAMSEIANLTGHQDPDGSNYSIIAHDYVEKWMGYGINFNATPPHSELNYGNESTYGLLYNIYSDKLLGTNIVPQQIFDIQSEFYPTKFNTYGVPLDTRHTYTKSDWEMWCAAVASESTRKQFIDVLAKWVSATPTNSGMSDWFDTFTADFPSPTQMFRNRPAVGGFFALLGLNAAGSS